ncbi:hypothetical protein V8B97DRAFT_231628 [Scleroderma yunnanense]
MFYENRSAIISSLARLRKLNVVMHQSLIDHIIDCVVDAVEFSRGNSPSLYRPSLFNEYTLLRKFISRVLCLSHVSMGVILIALAHIDQMKVWNTLDYGVATHERVFLGGLILANQFIGNDTFTKEQLEGADLLFDKSEIGAIETRFLLDFGFGTVTIEEDTILALHETFVEIAIGEKLCRRARCQIHDHSRTSVAKFCQQHKEPEITETKLGRPTWWRKLLYKSRINRRPISVQWSTS